MTDETKQLLSTSASIALGQTTGSGRVTGGATTQRGPIGQTPPAQSTAICTRDRIQMAHRFSLYLR